MSQCVQEQAARGDAIVAVAVKPVKAPGSGGRGAIESRLGLSWTFVTPAGPKALLIGSRSGRAAAVGSHRQDRLCAAVCHGVTVRARAGACGVRACACVRAFACQCASVRVRVRVRVRAAACYGVDSDRVD